MVEMIRGAEPLSGRWFTGGPVCTPDDQIAIYADQYRQRLLGALREETLGVRHLLGDRADDVLWRYLAAHPSRSWTLNRIADGLADWLAGEPEASEAVLDMARLDRAVQRGFEAADGRVLTPADLVSPPERLALAPHVSLLRLTTNVHLVRSALLSGTPPPAVREAHVHLVVFRRGIKMRHWAVGPGMFALLEGFAEGKTLAEAVEKPVRDGWMDPPTLAAEIAEWFESFAERRLVVLD
jgi:Putative DNA-binding domain